jgi:hypothetical protein
LFQKVTAQIRKAMLKKLKMSFPINFRKSLKR